MRLGYVGSPLLAALVAAVALIALTPTLAGGAMLQAYQTSGNVTFDIDAVGPGAAPTQMGSLTLTNLTLGTSPLRAYLYAIDSNSAGLSATLNGQPLGAATVMTENFNLLTMETHRWDVTSMLIGGISTYSFTVQELSGGAGIVVVALAAVVSDLAAPFARVEIVDGMRQVGEAGPETTSISFSTLSAGSTSLWALTAYDDTTSSGEVIRYNGSVVGGPIDANLVLNGSLLQMSGTSVSPGSNTLSIQTGGDYMGWVLGAAHIVPEPATHVLLAAGLALLCLRRSLRLPRPR